MGQLAVVAEPPSPLFGLGGAAHVEPPLGIRGMSVTVDLAGVGSFVTAAGALAFFYGSFKLVAFVKSLAWPGFGGCPARVR